MIELKTLLQLIESLGSKEVLKPGINKKRPLENAQCEVTISNVTFEGSAQEYVQKSSELAKYFSAGFEGTLRIGYCDAIVLRAFECCLQTMFTGETSVVTLSIKSHCDSIRADLNDLHIGDLRGLIRCQVTLVAVANQYPFYTLGDDVKYDVALDSKTRGVELFKNERYIEAFFRFSKALKYLISIDNVDDNLGSTQPEPVRDLSIILYNNIASCHLKRGNFVHAIALCNKVLAAEPGNVKALFRRAVARVELGELGEARDDFQSVLRVESGNAAAAEKLRDVLRKMKEVNTDYSKVVKKMFEL